MKNTYEIGDRSTRPWGNYCVIDVGTGFCVKRIEVKAGEILSLQRHEYRSEHWIIVSGEGTVTLEDREYKLKTDDHFYIPARWWHRMANTGAKKLVFIEIQSGELLDENDIERKTDKYNRK